MAVFVILPETTHAKRIAPAPVKAVVHEGVRYVVAHFGQGPAGDVRGGYVQAWDVATQKRLWSRMVYSTRYEERLEGDVQDVFITKLERVDGKLLVDNELRERYEMDIASGKVTALVKKSARTETARESARE